jgi:hypothetical protein
MLPGLALEDVDTDDAATARRADADEATEGSSRPVDGVDVDVMGSYVLIALGLRRSAFLERTFTSAKIFLCRSSVLSSVKGCRESPPAPIKIPRRAGKNSSERPYRASTS